MRRERIIASLLGLLLLTGCTTYWQVYPGERQSKQKTAIIRATNNTRLLSIDGAAPRWPQLLEPVARVLPGPHEVEVAVTVTIDATAGGTYRVHFDNDNDAVWVEDSRSP